MTNSKSSLSEIAAFSQAISIVLLLLHFYFYTYGAFDQWGFTCGIGDRVLMAIRHTGLFANPFRSKALSLLFLGLSLISSTSRKDEKIKKKTAIILLGIGTVIYFASIFLLKASGDLSSIAISYMLLSLSGFLFVLSGGVQLSRVLVVPWSEKDPFGQEQSGFPQEERKRYSRFGLYLKAIYVFKGWERDSWINVVNPRRGVLILGSPGSGKSWFIIEPLIRQLMDKKMALFVYDFKYDSLTRLVYNWWQAKNQKGGNRLSFYSINFSDLPRSHRCNVLAPDTLEWVSDAIGASRTILLSMNKNWIHRQGEFFVESPINFLAALIWFLRNYKGGIFCTLPHAIELAQQPYDQLFKLLESEPEIQTLMNPFVEAYRNKTMEMLESQIASAKIPLSRLASPDIYYILTGNDLTLDINNPAKPRILCLGGDPPRQEALAPVISLFIDRLNKLVNRPGKYPCALVCDEFATVRAYSMTTTIATARSNNIVPILAIQDLSQLRTQYSREEADLILNITGNLFCGQVGGETARWISERFPKILQGKTTISTNSNDTSISQSRQWEPSITPATISTLSSGEFLGVVADDPGQKLRLKAFHSQIIRHPIPENMPFDLPVIHNINSDGIRQNFDRIKQDILDMMAETTSPIEGVGEENSEFCQS